MTRIAISLPSKLVNEFDEVCKEMVIILGKKL